MSEKNVKKIAITGVIGSGKSLVISIVQELGISCIDCDKINAEIIQIGEKGYEALCQYFNGDILDKDHTINKELLAERIFYDQNVKKDVETILHPLIKKAIFTWMQMHQDEELLIVEVPLLFENHWEALFDEVWVVCSDRDLRHERLQDFRQMNHESVKSREKQQMSQEEKITKATYIIDNNANKEHVKKQIYDILKKKCR